MLSSNSDIGFRWTSLVSCQRAFQERYSPEGASMGHTFHVAAYVDASCNRSRLSLHLTHLRVATYQNSAVVNAATVTCNASTMQHGEGGGGFRYGDGRCRKQVQHWQNPGCSKSFPVWGNLTGCVLETPYRGIISEMRDSHNYMHSNRLGPEEKKQRSKKTKNVR